MTASELCCYAIKIKELPTMELSEIMEEIMLVPKDRLQKIYDFIHFLAQRNQRTSCKKILKNLNAEN